MKHIRIASISLLFAMSLSTHAETQVTNFFGELARSPGFTQQDAGLNHAYALEATKVLKDTQPPVTNVFNDGQVNHYNYDQEYFNSTVNSVSNVGVDNSISANGDNITLDSHQSGEMTGDQDGKAIDSTGLAAVDGEIHGSRVTATESTSLTEVLLSDLEP